MNTSENHISGGIGLKLKTGVSKFRGARGSAKGGMGVMIGMKRFEEALQWQKRESKEHKIKKISFETQK